MKALAVAGCVLLAVFLLWCLLLLPRRGQPGWDPFSGVPFAHRGLHDADRGVPENSMAAFRLAVDHGFGAELDVHLMADGRLAVVHDSDLFRVCGRHAAIEDLTAAELARYPLQGTEETIPLLEEVLALFAERTPLIIELKVERGNAAALTDAVLAALEGWQGTYCLESFHPAVLLRLKERAPEVLRGQLAQNFLGASETGPLPWVAAAAMTLLLTTLFTRPDFIAYKHQDRFCPSLRLMKALYAVHEVAWTVRDQDTLRALKRQGVTPIFEGFVPDP